MSRRVAFVTEPAHPELRPDDALLVAPLRGLGVEVEAVPWGSEAQGLEPARVGLAVLRSPWDYFLHAERFLAWCDALSVPLENPAPLVRWNAHKRYLLELDRAGAARTSPTRILGRTAQEGGLALRQPDEGVRELAAALHGRGSDDPLRRLVIKPAVSGGALRTIVLDPAAEDAEARLASARALEDVLVQRYEPRLVDDGEWSLVFFDGRYSHAVLKRPARGDFRVQVEHGGSVALATPSPRLLSDEARVLRHVPSRTPLYARVDGFVAGDGGLVLVELELIEPELFLRFGVGAEALARAIAGRLEA